MKSESISYKTYLWNIWGNYSGNLKLSNLTKFIVRKSKYSTYIIFFQIGLQTQQKHDGNPDKHFSTSKIFIENLGYRIRKRDKEGLQLLLCIKTEGKIMRMNR